MEIINIKLQIKAMYEASSSYSGNNGRYFFFIFFPPAWINYLEKSE